MAEKELMVIELTEENIESMVYEIRGQKVMLDFDLARIYGYTTKAFNQQVQRNIEKFPEDFMFRLNNDELGKILKSKILTANNNLMLKKSTSNRDLRSQFVTANELSSKRRYNPYVFTEQGIYMLMTVLKGGFAVKQSKALIRLFKRMKDYIVESNRLIDYSELIKLVEKVDKHDDDIKEIKLALDQVMGNFIDPSTYKHFLILNGEKLEADVAYQSIYAKANKTIYIIDDYIDVKSLQLLKSSKCNVELIVFSDNKAKNRLTSHYLKDYVAETNSHIKLFKSNNRFHDRYIVIDYKTDNEKIYLSGSSSKDSGNKITTIMEIDETKIYHSLFDELLNEPKELVLND